MLRLTRVGRFLFGLIAGLILLGGLGFLWYYLHSPTYLFRRFPKIGYRELWATPVRWVWAHSGNLGQYDVMAQPGGGLIFSDPFNTYCIGPNGENWTPPDMADGQMLCLNLYALNPQGGLFIGAGLQGLDGKPVWEHSVSDFPGYETGGGLGWFVGPADTVYAWQPGSVWELTQSGRIKRRIPSSLGGSKIAGTLYNPEVLVSALVGNEVRLLTLQSGVEGRPYLSVRRLDGEVLWTREWGMFGALPILLSDGSVFIETSEGASLISPDGKVAWTRNGPRAESLCATNDGLLLLAAGWRLCLLDTKGASVAAPIGLPSRVISYLPGLRPLFRGLDGNCYLGTTNYRWPERQSRQFVLALDASASPLWQMQIGVQQTYTLAADDAGRLYGLRMVHEVQRNQYSAEYEAEIVCFEPVP